MKGTTMNFQEWYNLGVKNGYCSPQFCNTHDCYPMHETEKKAWDEGSDPCAHMVRLGSPEDWSLPDEWLEVCE